jgi:anti-sigma regulatory factor (Ser/Thr protein kinase)
MKTSRSFAADPGSARSARHFVLQAAGSVPPRLRDAIAVMTGELAMNAVQHARTDFEVTVELTGGTLRVQVTDSAANRPASATMPPPASSRGRGLPIVAGLADDWGVIPSPHGPGKTIWFTIAIPSPARPSLTAAGRPEPCPGW